MMQTFEAFAIGETIFVPSVRSQAIPMPCPDCRDEKQWIVSMPSGVSRTIDCPRCHGGRHKDWLTPRRHERTLEIHEAKVSEVSIRRRKGCEPVAIHTSVDYGTDPHIGHIDHRRAFRTREEAEAAGALLLEQDAQQESAHWRSEQERAAERAGMDIVRALEDAAFQRATALVGKIDRLKEKMLDAVRYPSLYGPKLTRPWSGAAPELTPHGLAKCFADLLEEAEIEGWSEEELHEATCHC